MALRDEINPKINKLLDLEQFLNEQDNRAEWLEVILDEQYSNRAVATLLKRHGFRCDHNLIFRFRTLHAE